MNASGKKAVVSLTPTATDQDTRTMKLAAAFRDLGWQSTIVENKPSGPIPALHGIEVRTLSFFGARHAATVGATSASPISDGSFASRALRDQLHFLRFVFTYFLVRPLQAARMLLGADIIYLHEYRLYPVVALARRFGVSAPMIYDAHDYYPEVYDIEKLSPFWRRVFLPMLVRLEAKCIANADAMVVVTEGIAALYREGYGVEPVVLRNAYDRGLEEPGIISLKGQLGLEEIDYLFVCVGNRKPGMAIDNVVSAMTELPDNTHLAVIGGYHEPTAALAHTLGLDRRVHVFGRMSSGQVVPAIRSANAAVVPYFPETPNVRSILPNGFFQSVAAELPLVYPPLSDIKRVIDGAPVGVEADACSVEALANAMQRIVFDSNQSHQYVAAVRRLAQKTDWSAERDKLAQLVTTVQKQADSEH